MWFITADVDRDRLAEVWFVRFLHGKVTPFFSFPYCTLRRESLCATLPLLFWGHSCVSWHYWLPATCLMQHWGPEIGRDGRWGLCPQEIRGLGGKTESRLAVTSPCGKREGSAGTQTTSPHTRLSYFMFLCFKWVFLIALHFFQL